MYAAIWQMSIRSKKADSPCKKIVSAHEYENARKLFVDEFRANRWVKMDLAEFNRRPDRREKSRESCKKNCNVDPKTGEKLQWEYVGTSERNQIYKNRSFTRFKGLENQ